MDGMLTEIEVLPRGSHATAAQAIGDTSVTVEDPTQFTETGGRLDIAGVQYDYDAADPDSGIITLSTTLTAAVAVGIPILVVAGGIVAQDFAAIVDLGSGHLVTVSVPYALRSQHPAKVYDPPLPAKITDDLTELIEIDGQQPGNMQVVDDQGNVVWSGDDGPMKPKFLLVASENLDFTSSWVAHDLGTITPPDGYTRMIYMIWVSAGTTFTDAGNVSVQPYIKDAIGDSLFGPAIANGVPSNGGPCSVNSMLAQGGGGESVGNPLTFGAQVIASGPMPANAGNLHMSVLAMFLR